jgi:regulator of sigma D
MPHPGTCSSSTRAEIHFCNNLSGTKPLERWRQQRNSVQHHLRQTLVCSLSQMKEEDLLTELKHLCTELIDYVSTGHSSIYRHNSSSATRPARGCRGIQSEIQHHIGINTDHVLSFNQKYEWTDAQLMPGSLQNSLHNDLVKLHRSLSLRFALEEQLLEL